MTEEHGVIGNWLTWPRYTWSHNISHPSCVGSLMHFFNKRLHGGRTFSIPVSLCEEKLCGWRSHVALRHIQAITSKSPGWGWALHDGCSFPSSCECRETSCTSYLRFMCHCICDCYRQKPHWCHERGAKSPLPLPRWMPGVILWSHCCDFQILTLDG